MAAVNEHTRKMITTGIKTTTDAYREGWDRIFGEKKQVHAVSDLIKRQEKEPKESRY